MTLFKADNVLLVRNLATIMKNIFNVIIAIMIFGGCSSLPQNRKLSKSETEIKQKLSLGQKAARKPYNYVVVDYMDVLEGQEANYLKAEAIWKKIHQEWSEQGRILGWGLAKARNNALGIDYITWKIVQSREDLVGLYNMDEISSLISRKDLQTINELTGSSRKIVGSEVLSLSDYAIPNEGASFGELNPEIVAFNWNFMTATPGREDEYLDVEHRYAQAWAQAKTDLNPRFIGWDLQEVIDSSGKTHSSTIRTVDVFRKDIKLSQEQAASINNQINNMKIWPQGINVGAMRKMQRVTFDVVFRTDPSKNGVSRLWKELEGAWTAKQGDGYRTKIITKYNEKLLWYDRDGNLRGQQDKPISLEFKNQVPQFSVYRPNGEKAFSIPYEMENNIWIEYAKSANANWGTFHYKRGTDSPFK